MAAVPAGLATALQDRYRLDRELGQGGMATVYLTHDLKHDRDVALKVLRPELAAVLGRERFLAEIRLTAKLDHPHILTLIDSGESDGFLWYVVPFIRGESLRQKLTREKQLGVDEALAITKQVAGALDYAHHQGVIHRDIKPENILLHEGEAMLADFGIALAVKEAAGNRLTETGLSLGTPQYMSPEQATGDRQLDARSDVYSLAAVLYELLAGEPPHSGATVQAVIAKLMTERPTRLRVVRDTVPEGIDNAVARALAKVPADRFASAAELAEALGKTGSSVTAHPRARAPRVWAGAVALLAVIVIGVIGILSKLPRRKAMEYDRVQLTTSGQASSPVISPDGSQIAYAAQSCEEAGPCKSSIIVRELAADVERPVAEGLDQGRPLRWSPGGSWLLVHAQDRRRPSGTYAVSRLGGELSFLGFGMGDFTSGGDTAIVAARWTVPAAVFLRRFALPSSQAADSIAVSSPRDAFLLSQVSVAPNGKWLALAWLRFTGATLLTMHDRSGRQIDSLPLAGLWMWPTLRWHPETAGLFASVAATSWTPGTHRGNAGVLRISVDPGSGRFRSIDTAMAGSGSDPPAFDFTRGGSSLVYQSTREGETVLWALERPAPRDSPRPVRALRRSSSQFAAAIARDGRMALYEIPKVIGGRERRQWFATPFEGGATRAISPALDSVISISAGDDRLFVAQQLPGGRARVMGYDIMTGRAAEYGEEPSDSVTVWDAGTGRVAVVNSAINRLKVLEPGGKLQSSFHFPDSLGRLFGALRSPDGGALLLMPFAPVHQEEDGNFATDLFRMSLAARELTRVGQIRGIAVTEPWLWTDDGRIHMAMTTAAEPRRMLYQIAASGGVFELEGVLPFENDGSCSISGNGRRWVCVVSRPLSDIYLVRNFDPDRP